MVRQGETGWLVEPDSLEGLVRAIARIDDLDRRACRQQAEVEFSLQALGDRYEAWFCSLLSA
jgi:UDP-glucose:tetrahydrobiopterin glucosyltransferase